MKIATWNINGLRARLDFILHWLAAREPDVVGLQELKLEDSRFPYEAFEQVGYRAHVHGQKSWNGVAVLVREGSVGAGTEVRKRGLPDQEDRGARLLEVALPNFDFTTVYCPNGKSVDHQDFPAKLAWFDTLIDYERTASKGRPRILCGDWNLCPQPIDSHDEARLEGSIFHTKEERQRFQTLLDLGYRDVFRDLHPEDQVFSWWDYRAGAFHRGWGLRIDLVLATPDLASRARTALVDREYRKKKDGQTASDHAPVIVELDDDG